MRNATVVLIGLLLAALGAPASEGEGPFTIRINGRGFDEHCIRLEAGESIHYRFRASARVDFNIHHHLGKEVFYPVRQSAVDVGEATFAAARGDTFCLMWENGAPGEVTIEGMLEKRPARQ